ncbi:nuclear factor NF-kappa-B p105 subunit isoform X2 [Amia ocellicauda]|uniref:nuclear factor NF-kappa-B p105 subunit isoform X2 n=1 Tax=Amia ocellicauda TaxID=2972642 RepID=UPI003464B978
MQTLSLSLSLSLSLFFLQWILRCSHRVTWRFIEGSVQFAPVSIQKIIVRVLAEPFEAMGLRPTCLRTSEQSRPGKQGSKDKTSNQSREHANKSSFPNLGILHVPRRSVLDIVEERLVQVWRKENCKDPQYREPTEKERQKLHEAAQQCAKAMDLAVVRLMFTAYLPDNNGNFTHSLQPALSGPIFDSKAPNASSLKILRMDRMSGSVAGGEEVFLLCDKVQKDDIQVRFYQEDDIGTCWEAFGKFGPTDVHRQYAVVFKTPRYFHPYIKQPTSVFVQLRRRSDGETSEPKPFIYFPQKTDRSCLKRKMPDMAENNRHRGTNGHLLGVTTLSINPQHLAAVEQISYMQHKDL